MKNIFLISGIHFTYKFVISDTKRRQKYFLEFLKYWSSSHGSNKLVIKAKMHAKTFFKCFCFMHKKKQYDFFCYRRIRCDEFFIFYFYLWETWPYAFKTKKHLFFFFNFFFDVLTKIGYFNTGFVSLRYKNTNQY